MTWLEKKDATYKELNLKGKTDTEVLNTLIENPIMLERPIVITKKRGETLPPRGISQRTSIKKIINSF